MVGVQHTQRIHNEHGGGQEGERSGVYGMGQVAKMSGWTEWES